jgi:PAS domain-containing protein
VASGARWAARLAWGLVAAFTALFIDRLLRGGRFEGPPDWDEIAWDLRDRAWRGTLRNAAVAALLLAAVFLVAAGLRRLLRRGAAEGAPPASLGASVLFAVGLLDAAGGAALQIAPQVGVGCVLVVRSLALAVALPAFFLHLRGRLGGFLVPPALALSLLGVALWRTPLSRDDRSFSFPSPEVAAADALARVPANDPALRAAQLVLERRILADPDAPTALLRTSSTPWSLRMIQDLGPSARPALLRALRSPDPDHRQRALQILPVWAHEPEVARAVVPLLQDPHPWIRREAAALLGSTGPAYVQRTPAARVPEAAAPLRALLVQRTRSDLRHAAFTALEHQDPQALDAELPALLRIERERTFREEVHRALLKRGTLQALRWVAVETGPDCRHDAEFAPYAKVPGVLDVLIELLEARSHLYGLETVLDTTFQASAAQVERVARLASSTDRERRRQALSLLSRIDAPRAVDLCRATLGTPDGGKVLAGLRARGRADVDDILTCVDRHLRSLALDYRPGPKDVDLADGLERRLEAAVPSSTAAVLALDWLARIDAARAARAAVRILERDGIARAPHSLVAHLPEPELRRILEADESGLWPAVLRRVPRVEGPTASRRLAQLLVSADAKPLRNELIQWTKNHPGDEVTAALLELLQRQAVPLRGQAEHPFGMGFHLLGLLAERGAPSARPVLQELHAIALNRALPRLAREARLALAFCGDPRYREDLAGQLAQPSAGGPGCRFNGACPAARALASAGEEGVDLLLDTLPIAQGVEPLLEELGRTSSARARDPLLERLDHASPAVRRAAALGLGHLKDRGTLEAVRARLEDPAPGVREAAAWAVQEISGKDAGLRLERHVVRATSAP